MTAQQVLFALGLVICVALLVVQALGRERQARLARWQQGVAARTRLAWARWKLRWRGRRLGKRPAQRREAQPPPLDPAEARRRAAEEAADLIERARRGNGPGDGSDGSNVIRPPRFGSDRRRDLH
ncbi:MAG: hypothetical protein JNL85_00470 [Rubrivivax sp.]|nr:hypothetical protein [Rubrivivax sp.]